MRTEVTRHLEVEGEFIRKCATKPRSLYSG